MYRENWVNGIIVFIPFIENSYETIYCRRVDITFISQCRVCEALRYISILSNSFKN